MKKIKEWILPSSYDKKFIWLFLIFTVGPLLPEYIGPFLPIIGFIVIIRSYKIKLTNVNKCEILYLLLMLLSTIWSTNKMFSICITLVFGLMFLTQLIVTTLCDNKDKLNKVLEYFVLGGALNGIIGVIQMVSLKLSKLLDINLVVTNPLYNGLDKFIYSILPVKLKLTTFTYRASSTYTNPNIFSTLLVFALPIALYLLIKSTSKNKKIINSVMVLSIFLGILSAKSRMSIVASIIIGISFLFTLDKKQLKYGLTILLACVLLIVPILYSRFSKVIIESNSKNVFEAVSAVLHDKSSNSHISVWTDCYDSLKSNKKSIAIGNGSGSDNTYSILLNNYKLNQPHAHSVYLEVIMELGIIGLLVFSIPLIIYVKKMSCIKDKHIMILLFSLILSFIVLGITDNIFVTPKQICTFFGLMGITESSLRLYKKVV